MPPQRQKGKAFPSHAIIFLDIEEGGRLPAKYHAYLRAWVDALARTGYRAGVYCSGMLVDEGHGVTIITADGICYAPGDTAHAWFLDLNSATSPDPSSGRGGRP